MHAYCPQMAREATAFAADWSCERRQLACGGKSGLLSLCAPPDAADLPLQGL